MHITSCSQIAIGVDSEKTPTSAVTTDTSDNLLSIGETLEGERDTTDDTEAQTSPECSLLQNESHSNDMMNEKSPDRGTEWSYKYKSDTGETDYQGTGKIFIILLSKEFCSLLVYRSVWTSL